MKRHIKNYLRDNSYIEDDAILCELCTLIATDIHHIIYKSHSGTDDNKNLIALCRECHDLAHDKKISQKKLLQIAERRINGT